MKLSTLQRYWLATLCHAPGGSAFVSLAPGGLYVPFAREQRTFDALADRGLIEWVDQHVEDREFPHNGYRITAAGREAIGLVVPA